LNRSYLKVDFIRNFYTSQKCGSTYRFSSRSCQHATLVLFAKCPIIVSITSATTADYSLSLFSMQTYHQVCSKCLMGNDYVMCCSYNNIMCIVSVTKLIPVYFYM